MQHFASRKMPLRASLVKTVQFMKLTGFLLLAACLQVSARGLGQVNNSISLSMKNAPLEKVFDAIENQTSYNFIYSKKLLRDARPASVELHNASIDVAMETCLKNLPIKYKIEKKYIILTPKEEITPVFTGLPDDIDVKGRVVNEKGEPVAGVTVTIKGTTKTAFTDVDGKFSLSSVNKEAILVFTSVNMETYQLKAKSDVSVTLSPKIEELDEVAVEVSTGYQKLPRERATGSFVQINKELYERRIAPDILTKLDGIASGVYFSTSTASYLNSTSYTSPGGLPEATNKLHIAIRGQSTLSSLVSKDPLIIVDNFPYEGDINNLNPDMIESVTVLKDAAAASIWGARAGNGVIVLTTKKGKINQPIKVDLTANFTIGEKPNFYYDKTFPNSNDFVNIEDTLFTKGYYNSDLISSKFPALSAVVLLLAKQRAGLLSASDASAQIDAYRLLDLRNDYDKYLYHKSLNQQYAVSLRGGSNNLAYALTVGFDNIMSNLVRNGYNRMVINSTNIFTPVKNIEITAGIIYSQVNVQSDNSFGWKSSTLGVGGISTTAILPYTQLADAQGHHLAIARQYSSSYLDSTRKLGFQDWHYRPLDELALADNTNKQNDIVLKAGFKYKFASFLNFDLQFQNETQNGASRNYQDPNTYNVRGLINQFSQYNRTAGTFAYPIPLGGILSLNNATLTSTNYRGQLNYSQKLSEKNNITAIAGAEMRQSVTKNYGITSYGYNNTFGTTVTNINYDSSYKINPSGSSKISPPNGNYGIATNRFISYYSNIGYTYDNKYTVTISGREDGANIFGVNTNDKIKPLWSAGLGWNVSSEKFYHIGWLPYLKFRGSYGYNGNVYNTSSYLIATYNTSTLTGLQYAAISTPPNPDLQWESVRNINIGMDFSLKRDVISGIIEVYQKQGLNLLQPTPIAPSAGVGTSLPGNLQNFFITKNAASTRTRGIDITLNSKILDRKVKWYNTFLLSTVHDKVVDYGVPQTSSSIQSGSVALVGKPLFGVYSYRWAGLDPTNGDPEGYLGKQVSKNYSGIINNFNPDSLVFNGSAVPTMFGSLRNTIAYNRFSLSFNIVYKLGYVFRRQSMSINLSDMVSSGYQSDYVRRWQKPGDENFTQVPSVVYPGNTLREQFYQYSSVLVEKGDLIRFQDINVSYDFKKGLFGKKMPDRLQIYVYVNNIGLIWKANKAGIDPDAFAGLPIPRTISFGLKSTF